MSQDFLLAAECTHLVMEEVVALSSDRRSLMPRAPVASANVVRILVNDEVYVPPGGLYAQAQVTGSRAGPFRIEKCDRTFTVQGSTESASFDLPAGNRVDARTLLNMFLNGLTDIAVEIVDGHFVFTDTGAVGPRSSILVGGSAAGSLGFLSQRGAHGRQVYPAWGLASAPLTTVGRFPKFNAPVRQNPVFKVTYVTEGAKCPRCGGSFVENDYRFNLQGDAVLVQDDNLLYQAVLKILLTRVRSNPYHPEYGSTIMSRIGTKAIGAAVSLLTGDVQTALANLQTAQLAQSAYQTVTPKERLYSVVSVRVTPSPSDFTMFEVDVVVRNASGDPVSISIAYSVAGAYALAGTNGQSLGLEQAGLSR